MSTAITEATTPNKPPIIQVDPDVIIPDSVRRASARATEIHSQVYTPEPPAAQPNEPVTQAGNEPPAPPASDIQAPPAAATPPAPEPPAAQPSAADGFEHKYKSEKGRREAAETTIRQLTDRVSQLEHLLAAKVATSEPTPPAPVQTPQRLVTPQEENEFGSEFMDIVGRRAREAVLQDIEELRSENQSLKQRVDNHSGFVQVSAQERMFNRLTELVPGWRAQNDDPAFLRWLDLHDQYSGVKRQELLNAAFGRGDADRVAAFFNGFLAHEVAADPARSQPGQVPPANGQGKVSLESLAAPGKAKAAAAPQAPAEKPIITSRDITAFYADVTAGKYRGREAERAERERQIFDAGREGRVRQ